MNDFLNPIELQTFPLKDKQVYLSLRRRRWKERGESKKSYSNEYRLYREGMKTTKEFGDFLKEELKLSPAEYILNTNWFSDFVLMINSPKSSLKREDFMVKSENQFRTCITSFGKALHLKGQTIYTWY